MKKYFTFSSCALSNMICIVDGCLEILITLVFSTFLYTLYSLSHNTIKTTGFRG